MKFFIVLGALCFIQLVASLPAPSATPEEVVSDIETRFFSAISAIGFRLNCVWSNTEETLKALGVLPKAIEDCVKTNMLNEQISASIKTLLEAAARLQSHLSNGVAFLMGNFAVVANDMQDVQQSVAKLSEVLANFSADSPARVCINGVVSGFTASIQKISDC